jgi:capsular polysaccharide biosynthesis protein
LRRKLQNALRAEAYRRVFTPAPVEDVVPNPPFVTMTEGEPWDGDPWNLSLLERVPLEAETLGVRSHPTATRPVRTWFLPDALVAPGDGILLAGRSRRVVAEALNTGAESLNAGHDQSGRLRRLAGLRPSPVGGNTALFFSPGRNHYHTLVDNLGRIGAFGLPPLASTEVDVLYTEPLTAVERFVLDRIRPPNVSMRALDSKCLVRAERLVLPAFPAWRYSGWLPPWYLDRLRGALLPDRPPRRSERLYIVRRGLRAMTNEKELVERLHRHGFRPVELETLTFAEQVELFYDAEAIVAAHGAGLTNLLFARRALVVEIAPARFVFPHYLLMSTSLGHHHRFVLGTGPNRWEDFEADLTGVEHELEAGLAFVRDGDH